MKEKEVKPSVKRRFGRMSREKCSQEDIVEYVGHTFAVYHGMTDEETLDYFERTGLGDYVREW